MKKTVLINNDMALLYYSEVDGKLTKRNATNKYSLKN
jgi:hypothetical protein